MGNTVLKLVGERVDGFKKELAPEKNYITTLTHSDFDTFISGSATVVYMYTPWSERDVSLRREKKLLTLIFIFHIKIATDALTLTFARGPKIKS